MDNGEHGLPREAKQRDAKKTASMDIPAINACATYSYGYSNVHRRLAKNKAEQEGRVSVTAADVADTAIDACKIYLSQLEMQDEQAKKLRANKPTKAATFKA